MSRSIRDAFISRLSEIGIETHCMPRFLKDISFIFEGDPSMDCWELNNRLHLLGWNGIEMSNRMMELARASVEM